MHANQPTVLLVDDDEDSRIMYASVLEEAGYRVLVAADGAEGVAIAVASRPDVVLLDVMMPVLDGCAAARALKERASTRDVPVIGVTAAVSRHNRGDLTEAGFDAVLLKPLNPSVVLRAVRQALA